MKSKRDMDRLVRIVEKFAKAQILVVGDLMVDQFIWGKVDRISPEAPVPVVRVQSESLLLGGAANVANNLRSLGARAPLCGIVGDDAMGDRLLGLLKESAIETSGVFSHPRRPTIVKTRIIAHSQQVVRVDWERDEPISRKIRDRMLDFATGRIPDCGAVIISDYGKGVVDRRFADGIKRLASAKKIPVAVDPHVAHTQYYKGASVITPNNHEAGAMIGRKLATEKEVLWGGRTLLKKLDLESVLVTRGEQGMTVFERGGDVFHIPTVAREVFDVTGAGDTVIAVFALARAVGAGLRDAAVIANAAAGIVVGEIGKAVIDAEKRDPRCEVLAGFSGEITRGLSALFKQGRSLLRSSCPTWAGAGFKPAPTGKAKRISSSGVVWVFLAFLLWRKSLPGFSTWRKRSLRKHAQGWRRRSVLSIP